MYSPNLSKSDCMSDVARICIIITFHLSKLWKVKFSLLCDVIFLVGLEGNFDIDHSQEWKGYIACRERRVFLALLLLIDIYAWTAHLNPFTPESDQCQISPAASQEIWHHTVWRTWLFIAYSDEKWSYYKFSLRHSYNRFLKGWENVLFELGSERVNPFTPKNNQFQISPAVSPEI